MKDLTYKIIETPYRHDSMNYLITIYYGCSDIIQAQIFAKSLTQAFTIIAEDIMDFSVDVYSIIFEDVDGNIHK